MDDQPRKGMSRREFARRAAFASAVASLGPVSALHAETMALAQVPAGKPAQQPANLPKLSPESQAEADARAQLIFAQYGSRLSEEQKPDIRRLCAVAQRQLDRLRAYNLDNGDAPALYLKPLVEREKKPATKTSSAAKPSAAPKKP